MEKYNLYAIDLDMCGKTDEPIKSGQCSGCKYYKGFELYNALRCIKCSYYAAIDEKIERDSVAQEDSQ